MRLFFDHALGLTKCGWALLLALTILIAGVLYVAIQVALQRKMFEAVQSVDVLGSFCVEDPALADSCSTSSQDEDDTGIRLSDQAIWHLLREAQLIDTEVVEWPGALADAPDSVRALRAFLSAPQRQGEHGVALLASAAEICGEGRPVINSDGSDTSDTVWVAMIARLIAGTGKEAAQVAAGDRAVGTYLSLPATPGADSRADFRVRDAALWRFSVPPRLADAKLVAALVDFSGGFQPDDSESLAQGLSLKGNCTTLAMSLSQEDFDNEELYGVALGRIGLALWVAGQIRRDSAVARVSARVSLYTGPEQFGILAVFTFGVLLAATRLIWTAVRYQQNVRYQQKRHTIGPHKDCDVEVALERMKTRPSSEWGHWPALLTQRIASPRWPLATAAVLLPALGFVGTVRGIKTSLASADVLVFANTLNERADAIGALAGDLGHAFGTTLLALLGSLVLTILLAIEGRVIEMLVIQQIETVRVDDEGCPDCNDRR